jgi:hypothetical protein
VAVYARLAKTSPEATEVIDPGSDALVIVGVDEPVEEMLQSALILLGFIQQDDRFVALINGSVVEANEIVNIAVGTTNHRLIVRSVSSEQIVFDLAAMTELAQL